MSSRRGRRAARWLAGVLLWLVALALPSLGANEDEQAVALEAVIEETEMGNAASAEAQALIDELSDDIDQLASEYRRALDEARSLGLYGDQLEELLQSQETEMASLRRQIDEVSVVSRQVMPLMVRMIDSLEKFIELDVPFLVQERRERVAGLRAMMQRADVSLSEKYRRLIEAYQIENEFGRTIEAYRGDLQTDSTSRTVDFLRIGRIALLYQTLDAQEAGAWESEESTWTKLPDSYRSPIREGLRIARKQVAPDLVRVPVSAPKEAR